MAKLPYSRVVNVTLTRNDSFATKRGFGVPIILTNEAITGVLDKTIRTKVYGSIEEVAVDFNADTSAYLAFESAFSQNPRPLQVKVGFVEFTKGTTTSNQLKSELDALYEYDNGWYWLTIVKDMRDDLALDGLIQWTQAKSIIAILDSNDAKMEVLTDTTNIAARNKGKYDRTAIVYSDQPDEYPSIAIAAYCGTRNFDQGNSRYTAKFKRLYGITPLNKGSSVVQAVTGFVPALGEDKVSGHVANTYVDIGGQNFFIEGSTLMPNTFIDEIHTTDWIIARTEEETLGVLLNNASVPYTDTGMELLASGARTVMTSSRRAGLIAMDVNLTTGDYEPAVIFNIPSVFDVPESQRKARIAPEIAITFRYAGSVHYTTINYKMTF